MLTLEINALSLHQATLFKINSFILNGWCVACRRCYCPGFLQFPRFFSFFSVYQTRFVVAGINLLYIWMRAHYRYIAKVVVVVMIMVNSVLKAAKCNPFQVFFMCFAQIILIFSLYIFIIVNVSVFVVSILSRIFSHLKLFSLQNFLVVPF